MYLSGGWGLLQALEDDEVLLGYWACMQQFPCYKSDVAADDTRDPQTSVWRETLQPIARWISPRVELSWAWRHRIARVDLVDVLERSSGRFRRARALVRRKLSTAS